MIALEKARPSHPTSQGSTALEIGTISSSSQYFPDRLSQGCHNYKKLDH